MASIDKIKEENWLVKGNICYFNCHGYFLDCLADSELWES